ncbi:Spy/CpxP family protein refolding chaperone [Elusimicrobiota bacterium]
MKERYFLRITILALCAVFLSGTLTHAEKREKGYSQGDMGKRMEERTQRMEKELLLSPEQSEKLKEHRKTHRKQSSGFQKEMKEKRKALKDELEKTDMDMNKVKTLHSEIKSIQNKMADHRLEGILNVRKILNPEQFKKFQDITKKRHRGMRKEGMRKNGKRMRGNKKRRDGGSYYDKSGDNGKGGKGKKRGRGKDD